MNRLDNIKKYDEFYSLNESLLDGSQKDCNRAFFHNGPITFADGKTVRPEEISKVVNDALLYLQSQYTKTFEFATKTLNIVYLAHSNKYKTMAVDKYMNLYLNAGFVYNTLKMDPMLIAAVIMHEVFHALYKHIPRGENWLTANGKPKNPQTWHDTNLAADVEVNQTLVRIGLIEEERLINEIKAIYLKTKSGNKDVVTMETILNDEEYMEKLRSMCPPPDDPEQGKGEEIETSPEWDEGYKDAYTKIAELIDKYGYKGAWEKLQEAGLINSVGEIVKKDIIDDLKDLEFLQVRSFDDFINEDVKPNDRGKTYEDGFNTAFGRLIKTLNSAINGKDDDGEGGEEHHGPQGPKFKTNLKDLPEIKLPLPKSKSSGNDDDGIPDNVKDTNNDDGIVKNINQDEKNQNDDDNQDGDSGENGLEKDLDDRTDGGKNKQSTKQDIDFGGEESSSSSSSDSNEGGDEPEKSIGNTGVFEDEGPSDDDLRDAGYSEEDIASIKKVIDGNKQKNTQQRMEKIIDSVKRNISKGSYMGKLLDAIEIESEKYKNVWRKIMERFLSKKTRRAGHDTPTGSNDWLNKRHIARGEYAIHRKNESQDPQDVNIYVDVSGSMDMELLEIICKSLVVYTQEFEYSGINVCPWASHNNGIHKIEEFYDKDEKEVSSEILKIVGNGQHECGGGTESRAVLSAMIEVVKDTLADEEKEQKDDVHIVITDGYFDFQNIESNMTNLIKREIGRNDVAETAPENTFWMIYDAPENYREQWKNEIKKGTLIFINSEVVKNNG